MALKSKDALMILAVLAIIVAFVFLIQSQKDITQKPGEPIGGLEGFKNESVPIAPPIEEPKAKGYFPESSPEGWEGLSPELNPESCEEAMSPPFALIYCSNSEISAAYSKRWVEQADSVGMPIRVISGNVFLFEESSPKNIRKTLNAIGIYEEISGPPQEEFFVLGARVERHLKHLYLPRSPEAVIPDSLDEINPDDFEKLNYFVDVFGKGEAVYALYYEASAHETAKELIGLILEN